MQITIQILFRCLEAMSNFNDENGDDPDEEDEEEPSVFEEALESMGTL